MVQGLHLCGRAGGGGGRGSRGEGGRGGGGILRALPQHLQLLRAVPPLVLEAPPAQACPQLLLFLGLVGGQLPKPQTQTHVHKTPSLLSSCKVSAVPAAAALLQGGWQRGPPAASAPQRKGQGPRGLLGAGGRASCSPSRCLFGGTPGPGTHPALERAGFPRGPFHWDASQPSPALCLRAGWGRSPAPRFVKGCLLWVLLTQPRWFCLLLTRNSAGLDALRGGRPAPACWARHSCTSLRGAVKPPLGGTRSAPRSISRNIRSNGSFNRYLQSLCQALRISGTQPLPHGVWQMQGVKGDGIRTPPEGRSQMPPGQPGGLEAFLEGQGWQGLRWSPGKAGVRPRGRMSGREKAVPERA